MWISLVEKPSYPLELIAFTDPAVDHERVTEDIRRRYEQTRDRSVVPLKPGKRPILFQLETLTDGDISQIDASMKGAVKRLPDGSVVSTSGAAVLDAVFGAACRRVMANIWDPDEGHRFGPLPPQLWHRIPDDMRHEIALKVRRLAEPAPVPAPETDPGKS